MNPLLVVRLVNSADFCPRLRYMDALQPIGWNATISAPQIHAYVLSQVVKEDARLKDVAHPHVLDVWAGSGYLMACFAKLLPQAHVIGIEHVPELTEPAKGNIAKHNRDLLDSGCVQILTGDARLGYLHWPHTF